MRAVNPDTVDWLVNCSSEDPNWAAACERASVEDLRRAHLILRQRQGRKGSKFASKTAVQKIERALRRRATAA